MRRKAQVALEFIMTYGWAIFIVIAGIAALAYFGVFNLQNQIPEKCLFEPQLPCTASAGWVHPNSEEQVRVTFFLVNNLPGNIIMHHEQMHPLLVHSVSGMEEEGSCIPEGLDPLFYTDDIPHIWNSNVKMRFLCAAFMEGVSLGDRFKVYVDFNFSRQNGVYDKSVKGELTFYTTNGTQFVA